MSANDKNTEYIQIGVDALKETGYVARMFYDSWCCPLVITSSVGVDFFKKQSLEMIKLGLMSKERLSLKDQIKIYKEQMDDMSRRLKESDGNPKILNETELDLWWLNVFALIKMKALKDDDANGLLVMKN